MANVEQIRTTVGIIGNVISLCLFLSPMPTMIKIIKEKTVGGFKPDPYVATILNCVMWCFYALPFVHPDSLLVMTINGAGLIIEVIYITIFVIYSDGAKRKKIFLYLFIEAIFCAIIFAVTVLALHGTKDRSMLVGIVCIVLNIIMYASPLTVMKNVIATKSVKYMPFPLSFANFCNGCVWFTFALLKFDIYILVPNGIGVLAAIVQLGLYATFYKTTNWDEDEEKKPEVELSSV